MTTEFPRITYGRVVSWCFAVVCGPRDQRSSVPSTYHHAQADLLAAILLLHRVIKNDVQEDIVSSENSNDLAASVELDEQLLVKVLCPSW
jgi:hypothetical protein